MQNATAKKKKPKQKLIYQPYLEGRWHTKTAARRGLHVLLYYLIYIFLYVILGSVMSFDNLFLRVVCNGALVIACMLLQYANGTKDGENEVAIGEIAYQRKQSGQRVDPADVDRCFHPLKGWFVMLCGVALPFLMALVYAVLAQPQTYELQALPGWVSAFSSQEDIYAPLSYYPTSASITAFDILRIVVRVLILPFANIVGAKDVAGLLLIDRLSPLLVVIPALGYPLGYLQGKRIRAMVHGNIATNTKRAQRKAKKAIKERRMKSQQKNKEII